MLDLIKKYWDLLGGLITGVVLSFLVEFKLEKVQLTYSIIILILVSIGVLKIIKQTIEKERHKKERPPTLIDGLVDSQKPIKAINMATEPIHEGEKLGNLLIETMRGVKRVMKKIKVFFDKFKGYLLTMALGVLTVIEMCGGFINDALGDALTVNGVKILPLITLGAALIVGCISNGFTKEQKEKIKALFTKSTDEELVNAEIKKTIKEDELKLKEFNKILAVKETELENLNTQLTNAKNTHQAKQKMFNMVPQLATTEDVQLAANEVVNCEAKIVEKKQEIDKTKKSIDNLTTKIGALKTQL